jgi:hypothetical protein
MCQSQNWSAVDTDVLTCRNAVQSACTRSLPSWYVDVPKNEIRRYGLAGADTPVRLLRAISGSMPAVEITTRLTIEPDKVKTRGSRLA